MRRRTVKIKTWDELVEAGEIDEYGKKVFAPLGSRFVFTDIMNHSLPDDRVIVIQNDNTWWLNGRALYMADWMIAEELKPDAIEDQAQAHGEGRLNKTDWPTSPTEAKIFAANRRL